MIPTDLSGIAWYQNIYAHGLQKMVATGVESVSIKLQLVDSQTNKTLQEMQEVVLVISEEESRARGIVQKEMSGYQGKEVVVRIVAEGLSQEAAGVVPGLVGVFTIDKEAAGKQQPQWPKHKTVAALADFALLPSYPNPFNPETTIRYDLAENSHVLLRIYNLLGQPVRTLMDNEMPAGQHTVHWNGKDEFGNDVAGGVYICQMQVRRNDGQAHLRDGQPGEFQRSIKLLLVR